LFFSITIRYYYPKYMEQLQDMLELYPPLQIAPTDDPN
jgi:hypothetical protein